MMRNDSCRVFAELKPPSWQGRKWNTLTSGWCVCSSVSSLFFPHMIMWGSATERADYTSKVPCQKHKQESLILSRPLNYQLCFFYIDLSLTKELTPQYVTQKCFFFCVSFTNEYYKDLTVKRLSHQTSFSMSLCRGLIVKSARYGVAFHFTNCEDMHPLGNKLKTAHFCRNALNETVVNRTTHFKEKEQKLWFSRGFALFI